MDLSKVIPAIAQQEGVDPAILARVINTESGGNPAARSPKGAIGPAQLMPGTARDMGVNINDPADNIRGGARYLKQQMDRFKDPALALAAYNAGPDAVARSGGIPSNGETPAYVSKVMGQPQGSDDIFGFSGQGAAAPQKGGSSDDIFAMKPTEVSPPAAAEVPAAAAAAHNQPPSAVRIAQQYATGVPEGGKPLTDTLAQLFGIPAYLRSGGFANQVLHAVGRPSMPTAPAPQTAAERLARTAGQMTVGAAAPGSLLQRGAAVVGPSLGSEGGGALFKGTPLEGPARFVGAALGGAAAGGIAGAVDSAVANAKNPRITPDQLRKQADSLYTEMRNRDVQFTPQAVGSLRDGMNEVIGNLRAVYPTESGWVDTIAHTLSQDPTASTLDTLRSKMQQALTTPNGSRTPDQLRVGSQLVDEVDKFMAAAARHPDSMTTGTGDPAQVGNLLGQARDIWKRMRNVETVQNLAESAGIQNASSHMGGNAQNMTARKLRTFIDPSTNKSLAGLSPEAQGQLRDVVMGTPATKALKLLGNLSPTKGLGMLVNLTAGALTGGHAPLAIAPVGYGANVAGAALQRAQLENLLRTLATPGGKIPVKPPVSPALQGAIIGGAMTAPQAKSRAIPHR